MPGVLRKLLFFRNLIARRKSGPDEIAEEKWIADFSRQKHARFDSKSEPSYDASLKKNLFYSSYSLVLGLKKAGCIAWTEAPERRYRDLVVSGSLRIDARGGYGAGGILFRMVDEGTYYSFLISNKGYFRLDALRNGMPLPLVGWTELPISAGAVIGPDQAVDFTLAAYGSHLLILVRGRWAAEVNDASIPEGTLCFAAASYESGDPAYTVIRETKDSYTAEIFLESLVVDSRIAEVSSFYEKWHDSPEIDAQARFLLAETFTAMDQYNAAMIHLRKAWETPGHRKTQRELLLAGRLAQQLNLKVEAESYISECFQMDVETPEGKEAVTEMAKILCATERFEELKDYCAEAVKIKPGDAILWTFQGHAHWNLGEYKAAAGAYDRAFELDRENGIITKNAANVYEVMGRRKEALDRYLEAGRVFLQAGNYDDLGLLVPKLLSLGNTSWEARGLAGKWAFAVEDWKTAETEFAWAEKLRNGKRPRPKRDGAQVFLEALLLVRKGKRRDAIPLFEEAASLEKDFALFHFRLAENLFLLDDNPDDGKMQRELNAALSLSQEEEALKKESVTFPVRIREEGLAGWINNFAAQVNLKKGNLDLAAKYLEKAALVLGDVPAIRVNRGVLFYLRGSLDKSLAVLDGDRQDDPEGVMANCAGNLLVRSGRFEEADEKYRKALSIAPDNTEYLSNRASCLIEMGLYGEADGLLARAHATAPGPGILEMISYVAAKKGEYSRAEQACRSALEIDPRHAPSLLSLGWILITLGRNGEAQETLRRLDTLDLKADAAKSREELRLRLEALVFRTIECAACGREWKVLKDPLPVPAIRLFAMPPDNLPAGSCLECGKTWCIGCAKKHLDSSGRFMCSGCGRTLKLINEGLKKIVHDWAAADGLTKKEPVKNRSAGNRLQEPESRHPGPLSKSAGKNFSAQAAGKRGRPRKVMKQENPPPQPASEGAVPERRRGRPRKSRI